jgi:hypothetical protein
MSIRPDNSSWWKNVGVYDDQVKFGGEQATLEHCGKERRQDDSGKYIPS